MPRKQQPQDADLIKRSPTWSSNNALKIGRVPLDIEARDRLVVSALKTDRSVAPTRVIRKPGPFEAILKRTESDPFTVKAVDANQQGDFGFGAKSFATASLFSTALRNSSRRRSRHDGRRKFHNCSTLNHDAKPCVNVRLFLDHGLLVRASGRPTYHLLTPKKGLNPSLPRAQLWTRSTRPGRFQIRIKRPAAPSVRSSR